MKSRGLKNEYQKQAETWNANPVLIMLLFRQNPIFSFRITLSTQLQRKQLPKLTLEILGPLNFYLHFSSAIGSLYNLPSLPAFIKDICPHVLSFS